MEIPWITTGIKKSSKHEKRLYKKFLKTGTQKSEGEYKHYKQLFQQVKKRAKMTSFF